MRPAAALHHAHVAKRTQCSSSESVEQPCVITRAVGDDADALVLDKMSGPLLPGDRFVLCSDGLTKSVPELEIAALAGAGGDAGRLVQEALDRRMSGNVTVIIVECGV